jgi:hypothetical protein
MPGQARHDKLVSNSNPESTGSNFGLSGLPHKPEHHFVKPLFIFAIPHPLFGRPQTMATRQSAKYFGHCEPGTINVVAVSLHYITGSSSWAKEITDDR